MIKNKQWFFKELFFIILCKNLFGMDLYSNPSQIGINFLLQLWFHNSFLPQNCSGHRMEWSSYHRLEDIHGFLDYLAQTFPDLCSVMTIGNSVEGRPLKVNFHSSIPNLTWSLLN